MGPKKIKIKYSQTVSKVGNHITLGYKDVKFIHDTLTGRSSPAQSSMEVFTFLSFAIFFYKVEINRY